ncbi:MAG: energy-coupling factor ABC transporter ATP-binding protein [Candidatus Hadarchaeum sp.]|uniref:energy-coupling factor ABC transporter ATP-binding protein n=1 Tax=Candidatus Hadarchaeum sp. TaxID=2883567 RepID=UPI003D0D8235
MMAVEVRNLHYKYPDDTVALRGVNLTVGKGEKAYIIGPNGSGKSTLLLHLNGILKPQRGKVVILGTETEKWGEEVKKKVGLVFQNPDDQLFMPTVYEDVAFGPENMGLGEAEIKRRVKNALKIVGMAGFEDRSPHHLSYGEKKRIAIATVLAMDPEILVLDEPTLSLDPWIKKSFIELLEDLGENRTVVISGHDLDIMDLCDHAYLMDEGRIVGEIKNKKEIFQKYRSLLRKRTNLISGNQK